MVRYQQLRTIPLAVLSHHRYAPVCIALSARPRVSLMCLYAHEEGDTGHVTILRQYSYRPSVALHIANTRHTFLPLNIAHC